VKVKILGLVPSHRQSVAMSTVFPCRIRVRVSPFPCDFTATRLRHFPRESLIARLSSGEASIMLGGTRGRQGESYLDDAQRATQSKGDSRRAGGETRRGCGLEGIPTNLGICFFVLKAFHFFMPSPKAARSRVLAMAR
jgi:hypothetical protein